MGVTQGFRTTPTYTEGERQQKSVLNKLLWVDPDTTMLLSYLMGSYMWGPEGQPGWTPLAPKGDEVVFEVFEQFDRKDRMVVQSAVTAAGASITVDDASEALKTDTLIVYNNGTNNLERMRITAVNTTTNVLTVVRAIQGSTAFPIAANAKLLLGPSAIGEGGISSKGQLYLTPVSHFGCCQHHREEIGASSQQRSFKNYWGEDWPQDRWAAISAAKRKLEWMCWFNGDADKTATSSGISGSEEDGRKLYYSAGFLGRTQTHNYDSPGSTFGDLQDYFDVYLIKNAKNRDARPIGMVPQYSFSHVQKWGQDLLITDVNDNQFGFLSGLLKIAGNRNGALPLYITPVLNEGPLETGFAVPSIGTTQGEPHIGLRFLQEGQPDNKAWNLDNATDETGTDITPVGLTTSKKVCFEWIIGYLQNLENLAMVFRRFS